jgi:small subunit ribosomal protein S33
MAANVMASVSNYARRMARLSARIFGEVARPTNSKSMKVVKLYSAQPLDKRPEIVDYYPRHVELTSLMKRLRYLGLYR